MASFYARLLRLLNSVKRCFHFPRIVHLDTASISFSYHQKVLFVCSFLFVRFVCFLSCFFECALILTFVGAFVITFIRTFVRTFVSTFVRSCVH